MGLKFKLKFGKKIIRKLKKNKIKKEKITKYQSCQEATHYQFLPVLN